MQVTCSSNGVGVEEVHCGSSVYSAALQNPVINITGEENSSSGCIYAE